MFLGTFFALSNYFLVPFPAAGGGGEGGTKKQAGEAASAAKRRERSSAVKAKEEAAANEAAKQEVDKDKGTEPQAAKANEEAVRQARKARGVYTAGPLLDWTFRTPRMGQASSRQVP